MYVHIARMKTLMFIINLHVDSYVNLWYILEYVQILNFNNVLLNIYAPPKSKVPKSLLLNNDI